MTLFSDLRRLAAGAHVPAHVPARGPAHRSARVSALLSLLVAAALLVACGGGTQQVKSFKPNRLIVFGDESSIIEDAVDAGGVHDGFKYGINDRSASTSNKCLAEPIFVQSIAALYGFAFEQCNPSAITPKAFIRAQRLALVDDATTGLAQQVASQPDLGPTDLVSVMIGSNDIIDIYERTLAGLGRTAALAEAQRRGGHVAEQVNAILKTGARALVITVPSLGISPYASNASKTQPGAATLLNDLTYEFNAYLRTRIDPSAYDGRNYGLVLADDIVAAMARRPASYLSAPAVTNVAACGTPDDATPDAVASAVLACSTTSLVSGAVAASHLWASDRHLGPNAHSRIGSQANARAINNPF